MINKELLQKELSWYEDVRNAKLISKPFSLKLIDKLFDKFHKFGMTEEYYCCMGQSQHCWMELVEEGNWDMSLDDVKGQILSNMIRIRKYLYNTSKYGKRFFIHETLNRCYIFIYTRDKVRVDYSIWFSK